MIFGIIAYFGPWWCPLLSKFLQLTKAGFLSGNFLQQCFDEIDFIVTAQNGKHCSSNTTEEGCNLEQKLILCETYIEYKKILTYEKLVLKAKTKRRESTIYFL